MRKNIVAGNWKMNTTVSEGVKLATEVNEALNGVDAKCEVIICVPFTHLTSCKAVCGEKLHLGAENCADHTKGAYTGEVSASMVASTGADYVILGHSERRAYYGETVEMLAEKTKLALENNLKVIFCIGEVLEEREAGKQNEVVKAQLESVFSLSAEDFGKIVLAYEPVWAIGTGKTASSEDANDACKFIRETIKELYNEEVANSVRIQYGGSVKAANANELFNTTDIDGGLVGGASLKADFGKIVNYNK